MQVKLLCIYFSVAMALVFIKYNRWWLVCSLLPRSSSEALGHCSVCPSWIFKSFSPNRPTTLRKVRTASYLESYQIFHSEIPTNKKERGQYKEDTVLWPSVTESHHCITFCYRSSFSKSKSSMKREQKEWVFPPFSTWKSRKGKKGRRHNHCASTLPKHRIWAASQHNFYTFTPLMFVPFGETVCSSDQSSSFPLSSTRLSPWRLHASISHSRNSTGCNAVEHLDAAEQYRNNAPTKCTYFVSACITYQQHTIFSAQVTSAILKFPCKMFTFW